MRDKPLRVSIRAERSSGPVELDGRLHLPESETGPGVVLCHPHPAGGGCMDVLLLRRIASELASRGSAVLRFDFGGVGASGGTFTNGEEETVDVAAAFAFMADRCDERAEEISMAGWSFGSWMCLKALADGLGAKACVSVAPPLDGCEWRPLAPRLSASPARRHYIVGDLDQFCSVRTLEEFTDAVPETDPEAVTVLENTDHFLFGLEDEVAALVAKFSLGTDP